MCLLKGKKQRPDYDPAMAMDAFTSLRRTERAFTVMFGEYPMLNDRPMKLNKSSVRMPEYTGKFANGAHFRLLVPKTEGLTDHAREIGLLYIVSLYVGDKFEKELRGNYFIFDSEQARLPQNRLGVRSPDDPTLEYLPNIAGQ